VILGLLLVICAAVFLGLLLAVVLVAVGVGAWAVVALLFVFAVTVRRALIRH
jgi:hypothetical protein